ncbi:hypothetical protein COCMIDRAFT_33877 [Bipolaris oryzae ATCC 44560]|uniref:Uncharacterized protein n=1 Tax=Bipolaris oryzae ATCC 44560 TaxID=930090 RepID=W6ZXJ5_COCMI|nr:uncharacterized protein COCMIDRAFT_33877 [Bipolaris oryzae ATCC 44560]EUC48596.1 hypothetical protein COCMIDRAFT_33877 [Bipolaris oryzae ATCC 44560]
MSKGILTGILDDISSPSDVTGSCQAEFCTWEPYQTLAVCSFVDDVSAEGAMYDPVYVLGPDSPNGSPMYSVGPESWSRDQMGVNISETFWMNTQVDWQEPDSRAEGHEPLRNISTTYVAYYPPCDHDGNPRTDWVGQRDDAANWKGFRGSLILCLQTLNSTYNSTMQTKVIDTQIDLDWQIKPGVTNNSQYRYCVTGRGNEEYCVGDTDITEWEYQMATSLTGAAAIYPNEANYTFSGQLAPNIVIDVLGDSPAYCNGSNVEGGFERRMNNIAISMSNALRTGNNAVPFRGTGWTKEQFFDVTFYWMSLPLAIYLTITLFLFSTIVTSSKADTPLWKSSPLVLLEAMNSSNRMQSLIQVESEARGTAIKLQHTGGNWHLQTMPVSSENKVQIA